MQAIDWIRKKTKPSTIIKTVVNLPLRAVTSFFQAPTIFNNNISFLRLSNILWGTITLIHQNFDTEISRLMKKERCFNCKKKGHTMLNCLEKAKVSAITNVSRIDNIENIDQRKE